MYDISKDHKIMRSQHGMLNLFRTLTRVCEYQSHYTTFAHTQNLSPPCDDHDGGNGIFLDFFVFVVGRQQVKDDTQHLLSSLHAIKDMRNYMWIMNKTLPDPSSSNGAAIFIAMLRHRLHCLGEFNANLSLFS